MLLLASVHSWGDSLAARGCAVSHCTPEATGVISQPLIRTVAATNSSNSLGSLVAEGCSGNGTQLTCLYMRDTATAAWKGTLKVLDAGTLLPLWGSAAAANSYNLDPGTAAAGQVPVNFANGSIAAGDAHYHVLYSSAGAVMGKLALGGSGSNYGLVPLSATLGVISQASGLLTLVDLTSWQTLSTLALRDPATGASMSLVGPSSAGSNVLYAIGYNSAEDTGVLFAVAAGQNGLVLRSSFSYVGRSGALPVVVMPAVSGLTDNLVLLHVPSLSGDAQPQNRLLGMLDSAGGLTPAWAISLPVPLTVAPTVDQSSQSLFYEQAASIRQNNLQSGAAMRAFNLQTIGNFPKSFRLNSHLGASQSGSVFTLLLGGGAPAANGGQYIMAFQPMESPDSLTWVSQLSTTAAKYGGGWNFAPAAEAGVECPVAIVITGAESTIYRACDR